jgi:hypothetical protein
MLASSCERAKRFPSIDISTFLSPPCDEYDLKIEFSKQKILYLTIVSKIANFVKGKVAFCGIVLLLVCMKSFCGLLDMVDIV